MKKNCFIILFISVLLLVSSCKKEEEYVAMSGSGAAKEEVVDWSRAQQYYLENISRAIALLEDLETTGFDKEDSKEILLKARAAFKKAEAYASYLNPAVGHRVNGPPLPIYKDDNDRTMPPVGLQKIEESIYEGEVSEDEFKAELHVTKGLMRTLEGNIKKRALNPERFFIATHQQLLRIISFSISGFDTPVSLAGLDEAIVSLESLQEVYDKSIAAIIKKKNKDLDNEFQERVELAVLFIEANKDFETFDRYTFIREHMNPVTTNWVAIRKETGLWEGTDSKPFNFDAPTFFEEDAFNVKFFKTAVNRNTTEKQVELGEKLFFDERLSENKKMSCATCHAPEKGYADGMVANLDNVGNPLERNTPTLINSVFQKGFFWDGRSESLMDQISSVFVNEKEFNSGVHEFSQEILDDPGYVKMFEEAYGRVSHRNTDVIKALSSYIATLNAFNSKFDRNIRAEEDTFTEEEKHGFNLYMGKALCATCHFMPLTNGTVPPFFTESEKEVIGVAKTAQNLELDDDLGFYWQFKAEIQKGMFKTPTVRNIAVTAPYMHNGAYETLEEVMDFYDAGGGGGLGFDLPHQTLPFDQLNLTEQEKGALVAYLKTLTDTNVSRKEEGKLLAKLK